MQWIKLPITPNEEGEAVQVEMGDLPWTPTPPPSPVSLDRPVIGLEQFLRTTGSPVSPIPVNGSEANLNGEVEDTDTGNSLFHFPERSLLQRLRESRDLEEGSDS